MIPGMGNKSGKRNTRTKCRGKKGGRRVSVPPGRESGRSDAIRRLAPKLRARKAGIAALVPPDPISAQTEPERNEPCPCGSGEKFKHCCSP